MKKLCAFFLIPQIIFASHTYESNELGSVGTHARDNIEYSRPSVHQNIPQARSGRSKVVTFQLTEEEERNADRSYKKQTAAKRNNRSTDSTQPTRDDAQKEAREKAQEKARQAKEKIARAQVGDDRQTRAVTTEVTPEQKTKIQNIKEGLNKLTDDSVVRDVFVQLKVHTKFNEVMENITNKVDQEVTQADLDSVQDFLQEIVKNKALLKNIEQRTLDQFSTTLKSVIQDHFPSLSSAEMVQFLSSLSEMTTQALESQVKKAVSKKTSSDSTTYSRSEKKAQHKSSAKGGMPSSSGDTLGTIFGLAFTAAIFELINTLAN